MEGDEHLLDAPRVVSGFAPSFTQIVPSIANDLRSRLILDSRITCQASLITLHVIASYQPWWRKEEKVFTSQSEADITGF